MPRSYRAQFAAIVALTGILSLGAAAVQSVPAGADTTTVSNDGLRDAWYSDEPALTSSSVAPGGSFGQLFSASVDGQVYAQPLVSNHTLLAATENNKVYGLDPRSGAQIWTDNLGAPFVPANFTKTANCTDITPNVGITATPVVDPATGIEYVTSNTYLADGTTPVWYMHALSVATGAEQPGWPIKISGAADNNPNDVFNAGLELQRPGLTLTNGVVYAAFGAHCDLKPYEGWVFGVSASTGAITARWSDEATASPTDTLGPGAGIWQAGGGMVNDASGQLVLSTGNGVTAQSPTPGSAPPGNLGQSVVRLGAQGDGTLKATDFFAPYNANSLNNNDTDLGSGGPVELPSQYFGTPAHPQIMLVVGKEGLIYLMDANSLGGYQQGASGADGVINTVQSTGVWGHPAVWPGDGGYVYVTTAQGGKGNGALKVYKYGLDGNGNPTLAYQGRTADAFGFSSSSPMVTSSATTSGSALVWVIWAPDATGANAQLRAYNPIPVNGTLQMVRSFPIGTSTKFTPPVADNGTVYLGTHDGHVLGFGSPVASPVTGAAISFPATTVGQTSTTTETITANQAVTVNSIATGGTVFATSATTPPLPATLAAGATLSVPVSFTPSSGGLASGALQVNTTGGSVSFPISGQGQTAGPSLVVDAAGGLNFGGVQDGTSSSSTVTYTNQGASTLHFTSESLPSAPYAVTGLPAAGATLAAGASVTATVTFSPQQVGDYTNNLVVDSDGGNVNVPVDGAGGTPPTLQISNTSLEYGQVPVGVTSTLTFTLHNSGGTVLTVEKSKPPAGEYGFAAVNPDPEGSQINPGATLTERVNFTPSAIGDATATWTINANDGAGVRTINFDGTGTAAPTPTVVVGDADVTQPASGTASASFPVALAPGSSGAVTDTYRTGDGSLKSSAGTYVAKSGSVTISPGQASTVPVTVNAAATPVSGSFYLDLSATPSAVIADNGKAYVSATPTTHNFVAPNATQVWRSPSETVTAGVPITLQSAATSDVTVTATTVDGTAKAGSDYTAVSAQKVTIPGGQTSAILPVSILADTNGQTAPATFSVALSGATGLTKFVLSTATVTVYAPSAGVSTPPTTQAPVFTSDTPAATASVGGGYSYVFGANGYPSPSFSVAEGGTLPPGLSLDPTGTLAGTPTAAGTYSFSVTATNTAGTATTPAITVTVGAASAPPVFTADSAPTAGNLGVAYSYTYAASGNPPPSFDVSSGGVPPGLTFYQSGQLSGTPTTTGTYTFTVEANNGIDGPVESPPQTITVGASRTAPPAITSPAAATVQTGQALSFTVQATGSPQPSLSETGALPNGVTYTDNGDGTASLSGTPATGSQGSYPLTLSAANGQSPNASQSFTLTVTAPSGPSADLSTKLTKPSSATHGTNFTVTLTVSNAGPNAATGAQGSITLPAGVSYVSSTPAATYASGVVTWNLGSITSGNHVNVKVTLVAAAAGTVTLAGSASATTADPNTANNASTGAIPVK